MTWLQAHYQLLLTISGTVTAAATFLSSKLGDKAPKWLAYLLDVLSWLPQQGKSGVLGPVNIPLIPSISKGDSNAK